MNAVGLVVAKAPVPGRVKTRLAADVGDQQAATLAAAALLDSIESCEAAFEHCYLALEGQLTEALSTRVRDWTLLEQRGDLLGERLANAVADTADHAHAPVVQIGMDTPQVTAGQLREVADLLAEVDAVVGQAEDGGWWVLGVRDAAHAQPLSAVRMSTPTTYADTVAAIAAVGASVGTTSVLTDVDTVSDAILVASAAPHTRFAEAWSRVPR